MAGIYIPNIEMPEEGWHKAIMIFSDGTVVSYYDCIVESGKAVPVPPHGRLIDADMFNMIAYQGIPDGRENTFDDGVEWLANKIDIAPTIIEAEGK